MRIDRLLAITVTMLSRDRVNARELAERFEISLRTVYRDLEALSLAGIPVIPYAGHGGGYSLQENYRLDRRLLNLDDLKAILSSLSGISHSLPDGRLNETMEKIASLVPQQHREELYNLEQVVIDTLPWSDHSDQQKRIQRIHRAIADSTGIEFVYCNQKGESSHRRIEPMTLFFKGYSWYLFGFCLHKNDYRFFRLSRMKELRFSDSHFSRRPASYKDFLPHFLPSAPLISITLEFAARFRPFVEDIFDSTSLEEMPDGRLRAHLQMPDSEWIYGMILSFGEHVRVVSPERIRDEVVRRAEKIFSLYKPDNTVAK